MVFGLRIGREIDLKEIRAKMTVLESKQSSVDIQYFTVLGVYLA